MGITVIAVLIAAMELIVFTSCAVWMVHILPCKAEIPFWGKGIVWCIFGALAVLIPHLFWSDLITMVVLNLYYLAAGWFLYHRSRMGLLYQLSYMVSMYVTQVIAIFLTLMLANAVTLGNEEISYLVSLLKSIFLLVITCLTRVIIRKRFVADRGTLKIRGMVLIPLFSLVLMFLYILTGGEFFASYGYGWLIAYSLLILGINVYCLYFWYDVAANQELRHKLELMQRQNELTHQYYEEMEKTYSQSRKIIHDIRNHIHVLEQSKKLDQTQKYFSDVHEMLNSLGLKFYSDNRMLNIVLNDKLKDLSPEQAECNLGGISLDFLEDMDITTIFGNLLDNAVEARKNLPDYWLKIRGEQIQEFTVVKISNLCSGTYRPGLTDKEGHEGLGLENVRQALEKYHGELNIEAQEQVFSVTLVFPGQ